MVAVTAGMMLQAPFHSTAAYANLPGIAGTYNEVMSHAGFRVTQNRWITVDSSNKMWSTEEGSDKQLQYSCLEKPMNSMKRQKDMTPEDETPQVGRCPKCY